MRMAQSNWPSRLPFFYGWIIIAVAFVTMAIGVTGRTAFSLLMPPLIDEFKWDRGLAAGAFSFGFLISAVLSPVVGRVMDARGPRLVILTGVALMSSGLLLAPWVTCPWHLYATLGVAVGGGANMMTYTAHSQFLPNWFVRRRAFAISIAFSGAGIGAVLLLPWLQTIILIEGWRASCVTMGLLVLIGIAPLALLGARARRMSARIRMAMRHRSTSRRCKFVQQLSTRSGPRPTGRLPAPRARLGSGGLCSATSWHSWRGTRYRCTRRSISSRSASRLWSPPGPLAPSALSPFPGRSCLVRCGSDRTRVGLDCGMHWLRRFIRRAARA